MADTLNYKCPNCSAGLTFESKSQKMKCEYCGSTYSLDELDKIAEQAEEVKEVKGDHWEGFEPEQWQSDEKSNMAVWSCPSCGAEILAEKTTGATVCPYCDNPMIMPEQFVDSYRPDYIIPFQKSKKEAVEALKKHYEGKPLLPKVFKDQNHLEEIKAVYVPFWLFDLDAAGRFRYEATRNRFWEDSDYRYTETKFYHVVRSGSMKFEKIPVDGSKAIDDTTMEAIEPYDYKDLTEFNFSYLSGYMADKYDQEPDALTERVYERMERSVKDSFERTVHGICNGNSKAGEGHSDRERQGQIRLVSGLVPEYEMEWQKLFFCDEWTDGTSDRGSSCGEGSGSQILVQTSYPADHCSDSSSYGSASSGGDIDEQIKVDIKRNDAVSWTGTSDATFCAGIL